MTDDGVLFVTLIGPGRANVLDRAATRSLVSTISRGADDPDVVAIVIRGHGDHVFCGGGDLKEMAADDEAGRPVSVPMRGMVRNLHECILETYKPTIAVLNGHALGAGAELALACDLRIAASGVEFAVPEALRGTGANFASVVLPRLLPRAIAMEMLYCGRILSSEEGLQWGLYNDVVTLQKLDASLTEVLDRIRANAPLTIRRCAEISSKSWGMPIATSLRLGGPDVYVSRDRVEGIAAFVERRDATWRGE